MTLDRFVFESGTIPELIKIDVEGAELLVVQGAERLLSRYHPLLILGVHSYWLPPSQTVDQIFELLERLGYEIRVNMLFISLAGTSPIICVLIGAPEHRTILPRPRSYPRKGAK